MGTTLHGRQTAQRRKAEIVSPSKVFHRVHAAPAIEPRTANCLCDKDVVCKAWVSSEDSAVPQWKASPKPFDQPTTSAFVKACSCALHSVSSHTLGMTTLAGLV